jgi:predicted TIM-barrel fold metal-dependent hydrolase
MKFLLTTFIILGSISKTFSQRGDSVLLKDYRPISIYKNKKSKVEKAKYPVIDVHAHANFVTSPDQIITWVENMDKAGIEKTIILSYATGKEFDSIVKVYEPYKDRFELWCGFDYTGFKEKGWIDKAVKELERCYGIGAKGVGELGDKGLGLFYSHPTPAYGLHVDDPILKPLFEKCAELNMPVNVHVAEPYWMYLASNKHNDGLMLAHTWQVDMTKEGILGHTELIKTLDRVVGQNPNTTFIACHMANCSHDLSIIGELFDKHTNLYGDIGARFSVLSPIPKYVSQFITKYNDRILYGTDMGIDRHMYETTFRILESNDEHFYEIDLFGVHWPLYGFGLDDETLKKIYYENAKKIYE